MFDGRTFDYDEDFERLNTQLARVYYIMRDGQWHQIQELADRVGLNATTQSISARIRDLRKPKFGGYTVEHRRLEDGLWEYRLIVEPKEQLQLPMSA